MAGQLGRVVCSLEVSGQAAAAALRLAPTSTVPQVGAVVENSREPVVVAADFALGWLPDAHALRGAHSGVRVVGPAREQSWRLMNTDC